MKRITQTGIALVALCSSYLHASHSSAQDFKFNPPFGEFGSNQTNQTNQTMREKITEQFFKDFSKKEEGGDVRDIEDVISQLYNGSEMIVGRSFSSGGYSVSIGQPISKEHALPVITEMRVNPAQKLLYGGRVSIEDRDGNLAQFILAIDRKIYRRGEFVQHSGPEQFQDFVNRIQLSITTESGRVYTPYSFSEMKINCAPQLDQSTTRCHVGGFHYLGKLPKGRHELVLYAMDQEENRAFAVIEYEL